MVADTFGLPLRSPEQQSANTSCNPKPYTYTLIKALNPKP